MLEVAPDTKSSSALVVVDATGKPLAFDASARDAVMAALSTIAPEELIMTLLLFRAVDELVPPLAMGRVVIASSLLSNWV